MNQELRDELFNLQNKIRELRQQLDLMQGKTRDFLFWQLGGQILLGSYFNFQFESSLVFWNQGLGCLLVVLAVMVWIFSSHQPTVLHLTDLFQEQKPEIQAAMQNQLLSLERQIHSWRGHTSWIHFLGWLGVLLHGGIIVWFL